MEVVRVVAKFSIDEDVGQELMGEVEVRGEG